MTAKVGGGKQRTQAARAGLFFEEVTGERESVWGTPTLAATGNLSDGEMGELLTREIKSRGDGEYLYAHLLTRREDASSWMAVELHFSSSSTEQHLLGWGWGTAWLCEDSSPIPPSHRGKETRWETCWNRAENLVVTPSSPPMGREDSKIHSIALT